VVVQHVLTIATPSPVAANYNYTYTLLPSRGTAMRALLACGIFATLVAMFGCNSQSTGPDPGSTETGMGTMNDAGQQPPGTRIGPTGSPESSSRSAQDDGNTPVATGSGVGAADGRGGAAGAGTGATSPAAPE
jgi:hypothetical protein